MPIPITMPMLGLTMEEGMVAEWLKQVGEAVAKDEPLLVVELDKGVVEVPSPAAGVLRRIIVQAGQTVPVKTLIGELAEPGEAEATAAPAAKPLPSSPAPSGEREGGEPAHPERAQPDGQRVLAGPRARARARELGVDIGTVRGTGPHGRVVEEDVVQAAASSATPEPVRVAVAPLARRVGLEHGVVRLSRVRGVTAERMATSARSVARVTLLLEADFTEAARLRRQLAPEFARLGVPRLPWDALLAKAAGQALAEHPAVNAAWVEGQGIRRHAHAHVGVAVALEPEGLVVPVLRDADTRSLRELTADLLALVEKARANRLSADEMQGGTFTITNLGGYRIDGFTPILNPPEAAILGVGRVADKPAVVDGRVEARTLCTLSLAFDHRVVDGAPAAAFLARLAELLESPPALLGA